MGWCEVDLKALGNGDESMWNDRGGRKKLGAQFNRTHMKKPRRAVVDGC
jgi:hypothetical protein